MRLNKPRVTPREHPLVKLINLTRVSNNRLASKLSQSNLSVVEAERGVLFINLLLLQHLWGV